MSEHEETMAEDTVERVLIKSALSTFRFFVVLGVGIVASKSPKGERASLRCLRFDG